MPLPELTGPRRPRWMLVDDDVLNVALMGTLLRQYCGAEVECFHDGTEALAAFASAPDSFDLIITDLEMPGLGGLELCRRLHAMSPSMKILVATGSGDITTEVATRAGFCGLLRKPFSVDTLLGVLAAAGQAGSAANAGEAQAACRASR